LIDGFCILSKGFEPTRRAGFELSLEQAVVGRREREIPSGTLKQAIDRWLLYFKQGIRTDAPGGVRTFSRAGCGWAARARNPFGDTLASHRKMAFLLLASEKITMI
jgi:hypothetical protein